MSIFPTKILLATDGSEEAQLALHTAVDLAKSTNSELHVLTVGSDYHLAREMKSKYAEFFREAFQTLERETQQILDEQVKKIEKAGGSIAEAHLRMGGQQDQTIVSLGEAIGAGLIVIGSRGLGGIRRALMGSVSDSVVRHAHCPVLVVRKEEREEEVGPEAVGLV